MNKFKYNLKNTNLRQFYEDNKKTDNNPPGQRPPVNQATDKNSKYYQILDSLINGVCLGEITIAELLQSKKIKTAKNIVLEYFYESIDGGHRSRAIDMFYRDQIKINDKFYSEHTSSEKKEIDNIEVIVCTYTNLKNKDKGFIFRTKNKTTDVNHMEMLNSYGDTPISNMIRNITRRTVGIKSIPHTIFDWHTSSKSDKIYYDYISFDNNRLRQDLLSCRFAYRYYLKLKDSSQSYFGGSSYSDMQSMYEDETIDQIFADKIEKRLEQQYDFLLHMHKCKTSIKNKQLNQHEFKVLSYLHLYFLDKYGDSFVIVDGDTFMKEFIKADSNLLDVEGPFKSEVIPDTNGYTAPVMFKKYIDAPDNSGKVELAINRLLKELEPKIEDCIQINDTVRSFSENEKTRKLADQEFKCAVDNLPLEYTEAEGGHIIAHSNGGKTDYDNLVMIRKVYNREMGTMDFNEYLKTKTVNLNLETNEVEVRNA